MLEPLVVKATRAVPRRERRSNPPDLSNEKEGVTPLTYPTGSSKLKSGSNKLNNISSGLIHNIHINYR